MNRMINLIPSGLKLIDKKWGGIYKGGSYLVIGPRKSGRTLLSLQFAKEAAYSDQVCLYFTNMRPKDLIIQASSIGFDIQKYMNNNRIIVVRVAPPNDLGEYRNPDEVLGEFIRDIVGVVKDYKSYYPQRIVFDELTPYLGFNDLNYLQSVFLQTLEEIEDKDISSFFIVSEPAAKRAEAIIDVIASNVTGVIYLKKSPTKLNMYYGGKIIITPNVGHTEGQFTEEYTIRPNYGVYVEAVEAEDEVNNVTTSEETIPNESDFVKSRFSSDNYTESTSPKTFEIDLAKLSQLQSETANSDNAQKYQPINLYEIDDFSLILNNQIALYKSTGQPFTILTFRLDPSMKIKGLLDIEQLRNAVAAVTERKDKLCVLDNKVLVLIIKPNNSKIENIFTNIKDYFPSKHADYITTVSELIEFNILNSNDEIENADYVFNKIKSDEQNKNKFITLRNILK